MSEYISRNEVYQKLHEACGCDATDEWSKGYDDGITEAIRIINEIHAADVAPVVHGKWVEPSYKRKKSGICGSTDAMAGKCRCSVCRHEEPVFEEYPKYNYCPNCGAKMNESEENDNV